MTILITNQTAITKTYLSGLVSVDPAQSYQVPSSQLINLVQDTNFLIDVIDFSILVNDGEGNLSANAAEILVRNLIPSSSVNIIGTGTGGFSPSPDNKISQPHFGNFSSVAIDTFQNLSTRGQVLTDEGSSRDDFSEASLLQTLTGSITFTNGSKIITGSGTLFTQELNRTHYIKASADSENALNLIETIYSDTLAILSENYNGSSITSSGQKSRWSTSTGSGSSITLSSGLMNITSGTNTSALTQVYKLEDFSPLIAMFNLSINQRISNQETIIGFVDDPSNIQSQAVIVFDGTDNTKIKFRTTYSSNGSSETQETLFTFPNGQNTASSQFLQICIMPDKCILSHDDVPLVIHRSHIPDPYISMYFLFQIKNTGAVTSTTLSVDNVYISNQDQLQITTGFTGDRLQTDVPVSSDSNITRILASATNVTLLSENPSRKGSILVNESTSICYVKLGTTASATSYTFAMAPNSILILSESPVYTGEIDAIWVSANGAMQITELV